MIALHILAGLIGTFLVMSVLISALETVVLPRQGFTHISRFVFAVADRILVQKWRNEARRENLRALYGPVGLVTLPLVWMLSVTVGFTFVFWAISHDTVQRAFEISGSSLTTLGFAEPSGTVRIWLAIVEATIGLGLVALLISYLPTIYAAHSAREKGMTVLRPFAGIPPSSTDMLLNLHGANVLDNLELWRAMADWTMTLDQSHSAFPALCFFPEAEAGQSWVASAGAMVDGAALLLSMGDFITDEPRMEGMRGAQLTLAYGMPGLVRIGRGAGLPIDKPVLLADLVRRWGERAPEISITRDEYMAALDRLGPLVAVPIEERDACWQRFAWIRSGYDRALIGLAGVTLAAPAPWTTDRPARVGRLRIIRRRPIDVDWTVRAPT